MRLPLSATLTVAICLLAAPAGATIITIQFTGKTTSMSDTPISEVFSVGDGFEIYLRYSDETLLHFYSQPSHREYWGEIGGHQLARSNIQISYSSSSGSTFLENDRCFTCGSSVDPPEYQPITLADGRMWRMNYIEAIIRDSGNPLTVTPETAASFNVFFQPVIPEIIRRDENSVSYNYYSGFRMDATQIRQVPEPGTLLLLSAGLVGIGLVRRRRTTNA